MGKAKKEETRTLTETEYNQFRTMLDTYATKSELENFLPRAEAKFNSNLGLTGIVTYMDDKFLALKEGVIMNVCKWIDVLDPKYWSNADEYVWEEGKMKFNQTADIYWSLNLKPSAELTATPNKWLGVYMEAERYGAYYGLNTVDNPNFFDYSGIYPTEIGWTVQIHPVEDNTRYTNLTKLMILVAV
jgi:hypothetical protein